MEQRYYVAWEKGARSGMVFDDLDRANAHAGTDGIVVLEKDPFKAIKMAAGKAPGFNKAVSINSRALKLEYRNAFVKGGKRGVMARRNQGHR